MPSLAWTSWTSMPSVCGAMSCWMYWVYCVNVCTSMNPTIQNHPISATAPFHHVSSTKQGQQGQQKATQSPCWLPALGNKLLKLKDWKKNNLFGLWKATWREHFYDVVFHGKWWALTSRYSSFASVSLLILFVKRSDFTHLIPLAASGW